MTIVETLAAFVQENDIIVTPLWDEVAGTYKTAMVTRVQRFEDTGFPAGQQDRVTVFYEYETGQQAYQSLVSHALIPAVVN